MENAKLSNAIKAFKRSVKKHSPEILMGIGIAGMATTTVMAVRATPKALMLIEDEKRRRNHEILSEVKNSEYAKDFHMGHPIEKLPVKDVIKITWKCYIPTVSMGVLSILCLIGSSSANIRRNTALATAYSLSESAFKEYQDKVVEEIGKKKENDIRDAISKDRIEKNPVSKNEVIMTGKGETLCYDVLSGRYFKSDIEKLRRAENDLNRRMKYDDYISLNEFYYEIGLDNIKIGDDFGWNIDKGYIELDFRSQLDEQGNPCLVLDYSVAPDYNYR